MFLHGFFQKQEVRKFRFTPFYYQEEVGDESEKTEPRIKFRKILRGAPVAKKSVRGMLFLAILLLLCLFYLWGLVKEEKSRFQLENIRIEDTSQ